MTRVGVEMMYKIYSPNVTGIEVVQRKEKRARRNKLYYMRFVMDDMELNSYFRSNSRLANTSFIGSQSTISVQSRTSSANTRGSVPCSVNHRAKAGMPIHHARRARATRRDKSRCLGSNVYHMYKQRRESAASTHHVSASEARWSPASFELQ